ncbi:MAG TPA: LuxR C-terminal-related transcriptional regulator [Nocardioidaceae bacterium]|nr:LuxR C-terminal-related transcriptional regulator [Nocardioidaceae bacterium]
MAEPGSGLEGHAQLPAEVTSFVGRRSERSQIRTLLTESRLVTLTGFGGVGKTRLALRMAAELRRAFADGTFFVPLGGLTDPDWLPDAISAALGLQGRSTRAAPTSLVEYLSSRNVLLILDNCEHVIDAAAVMTDTILRTSPKVKVLATSREPLRITGETVHPVTPLSVPARGDENSVPLQQFESVSLFVDRATALVPDFTITEENRAAVASICRRLEGIPLAIELAAARLRSMSVVELGQHLGDRWEVLSRGSRTAPDRQRTMAACIDWSFDLCTDEERDLWARASVFVDGFELDAMTAVCGGGDGFLTDELASLVEKSIVIASENAGRTRYRMLPPIRQRGLSRLREQGKLRELRSLHRDWFVDLAARVSADWVSPRQVEWIHRLRRESGNMRSALEFCSTEPGEAEPGLRMGADLLEFGLADGLFRPGRIWFSQLLPQVPEPTETRVRALRTGCWWAAMQGDMEHAEPLLAEGRAIARELGGHPDTLMTQTAAFVAMFEGETAESAELFNQAIKEFTASGNISQVAHCQALLALNLTISGDIPGAMAAHAACLAITEPVGESWYRSYSLWIAGLATWAAGDVAGGVELEKASLRLKQDMHERIGIGLTFEAIALMVAPTDPERATILLGAAENEWDKIETSTKALPGLFSFHEMCVGQLQEALGNDGYDAAWAKGRALSQSEAISLALDEKVASRGVRAAAKAVKQVANVLTPRERQIADLVFKGFNNKDIADALVISKRTAETHVEHILTKLGFNNRNQIAAWVAEQADRD